MKKKPSDIKYSTETVSANNEELVNMFSLVQLRRNFGSSSQRLLSAPSVSCLQQCLIWTIGTSGSHTREALVRVPTLSEIQVERRDGKCSMVGCRDGFT